MANNGTKARNSLMRIPIHLLLTLLPFLPLHGADWRSDYDSLLQKYASATGVDYKSWHHSKPDLAKLQSVVEGIGRENLQGQSRDAQLAFYLNAYNAWILHKILESYPTKGPGGGGFIGRTRFFRSRSILVAGQTSSFHLLENDIIRPQFSEPRIHFALNCASRSCPPLHNRAFEEGTLDTTLNHLTKAFINQNPLGIRSAGEKAIEVSEIFKWYRSDFETKGTVLDYINRFRESRFPAGTQIRYQDYQWTLNQSR